MGCFRVKLMIEVAALRHSFGSGQHGLFQIRVLSAEALDNFLAEVGTLGKLFLDFFVDFDFAFQG